MPRNGWKTVNLRNEPYQFIEQLLKKMNDARNPSNVISDLVSDAINSIIEDVPTNPLRTINQLRIALHRRIVAMHPEFDPKSLIIKINDLSEKKLITQQERTTLLDLTSQIVCIEDKIKVIMDEAVQKKADEVKLKSKP